MSEGESIVATEGITTLSLQSLIDTRYDVLRFRKNARAAGSNLPGQRSGSRRGQGIEFLDLRQYSPGDDVRHIDWNVTARSNEPHTRLYRQEKELSTTVLVDLRPVMFNGSDRLRAVAAAYYGATILWQSCKDGDRCACVVVDADGIRVSRPLTGNKGVLPALGLIATGFGTSNEAIGQSGRRERTLPQLSDAFDTLSANRRRKGHTIMISGFDARGDNGFDNSLSALVQSGQVTAALLVDKIEQQPLPVGTFRYLYNGKSTIVSVNKTIQDALACRLVEQCKKRHRQLSQLGISTLVVDNTCSPIHLLSELQQLSRFQR